MNNYFERSEKLLGKKGMEKLANSNVLLLGLGGVGGHAAEILARTGLGNMTIVDFDDVDVTNLNRQIIALQSTIGKLKVKVMEKRLKDINPDINILTIQEKITKDNLDILNLENYDYVADCIDLISAKIAIVLDCQYKKIPLISSMGFGNKLDPTKIKVSDIYKTNYCSLARVMRRELKRRGVKELKCVWSDEICIKAVVNDEFGKRTPASVGFVPSVAGIVLASEIIKDLVGESNE